MLFKKPHFVKGTCSHYVITNRYISIAHEISTQYVLHVFSLYNRKKQKLHILLN